MDELNAVRQYLPRFLRERPVSGPVHELRDGTMLFSDVSGFTALSEKLARHGKAGAEEMVGAISTVFTPLLAEIDTLGGDVLKFGGDALLTFFDGADHVRRAAACAHRMRRVLRSQGRVRTAYGQVPLGMSQGLHTGRFTFLVPGGRFADVVVTGAEVSATLAMESAAERGEILLSSQTAPALPTRLLGAGHDGGTVLTAAPPLAAAAHQQAHQPEDVTDRDHLDRFVPLALRGRLADVVADSEHRRVTVAFLQFSGCDEVLATAGPADLLDRLTAVTDAVTDAADAHGVTVVCVDVGPDGGKFMLTCGAPDAVERDAEAMLACGAAILGTERPLPLRMGVNRGTVYAGRVGGPTRWTYSTMGDTVNLAARVMGKALGGGLLATTTVTETCGRSFDCTPVEPFAVKGKSAPVHAALVAPRRRIAAATRASRRTPLVGREAEVTALARLWHQAGDGEGAAVEIIGEPGSGKSRLLDELVSRCGPRCTVRVGGERYHRDSEYFAAHLLLRGALDISADADPSAAGRELSRWVATAAPHLAPHLPLLATAARAVVPSTPQVDAIAAEFRPLHVRRVVAAALDVAWREPTLVLLEDAFWYDDASAELIADVLRGVTDRPWLVCVTRRPEQTGLHSGLGYQATPMPLRPLPAAEAVELARVSAAGPLSNAEAAELAGAAAGNPLFIVEMAQGWSPGATELPGDVESALAARLDRLPVPARRLLRRAAVLGTYVELPLLESLLDEPVADDVWDLLVGDFLVREGPHLVRFAHDLVRVVAYDRLPFRRRRDLHGRAAAALEAMGDLEPRAALLSLHFEAAGNHEKTWAYAVRAGARARAAYANREAGDLYDRALRAARGIGNLPAAELAAVAEALGDVRELLGMYDGATRAYQLARRLSAGPGDLVRLAQKQGVVRERQGRYREALSWYTRGLRAAEDLGGVDRVRARAALEVGTAAARYRQGQFRLTVAAAERAVTAATAAAAESELAHAYFLLDAALTDLHDPRAADFRDRALPIYQELGDLVGEADVHNNIGIDAYYEGRMDDALASYERSLDCRRRAGDVVGAATAENNIGEVLSDLGRFDEAVPRFTEALAVWRRATYTVGVALACSNLARVFTRSGEPGAALPLLDEAEKAFAQMGAAMLLHETRVRRAEALMLAGDMAAATDLVEELVTNPPDESPTNVVSATLHRLHGTLLARRGERRVAEALLRQALTVLTDTGMRWEAAAAARELELLDSTILLPLPRTPTVVLPDAVSDAARRT